MNTYYDPLYGWSYPSAKEVASSFKSGFNTLAEVGYQPLAGHFDEYATDSPSHSAINDNYFNPTPASEALAGAIQSALTALQGKPNPEEPVSPSNANQLSSSGVPSSAIDYVNAELAKAYGMDKSTAYQEALSNTAYQRAVADMKAAGLNPASLYGGGRGSSASGVAYANEAMVGSTGNSGKNVASSNRLSDVWNVVQAILPVATGIATMATTKSVSAAKKASAFTSGLNAGKGITSVVSKAFG